MADTNFVDENGSLVGPQVDGPPLVPTPPADESWSAAMYNALRQALLDIKSVFYRVPNAWYGFGLAGNGTTDDSAALTAAFASVPVGGSIQITNAVCRISSDVTIPAGVNVQFLNATIKIDSTKVLHVNGTITAPNVKIFDTHQDTATDPQPVKFGIYGQSTAVPQWWGAIGNWIANRSEDDTIAFKQCIAAFGTRNNPVGGEIIVPNGSYGITSTITFTSGASGLRFGGAGRILGYPIGAQFYFTQADGTAGFQCGEVNSNTLGYGSCSGLILHDMLLQGDVLAGPPLCVGMGAEITNPWNANSGVGADCGHFIAERLDISSFNPATQTMRLRGQEMTVRDCTFAAQQARSVPAIYMDGGNDTVVGSPSLEMGQLGDVRFEGITEFNQNSAVAETAPYCVIEGRGTGLGAANVTFEEIRSEQLQYTAVQVSGAQFVNILAGQYADSFGGLTAPCFEWTYNLNDSTNHYANFCSLKNYFIQVSDSDAHPSLLDTGNPGGGSSGVYVECCNIEKVKSTNSAFKFMCTVYSLASGSAAPVDLSQNGNSIRATGFSSKDIQSDNTAGQFTLLSGHTTITVAISGEADTNYRIVATPVTNTSSVADSWVIKSIAKSTGQFIVTVAAAPDADITFDWHLLR